VCNCKFVNVSVCGCVRARACACARARVRVRVSVCTCACGIAADNELIESLVFFRARAVALFLFNLEECFVLLLAATRGHGGDFLTDFLTNFLTDYAKLIVNFSHESDVTFLRTPF